MGPFHAERNSRSKGPGVGMSLLWSRNGLETSVHRVGGDREGEVAEVSQDLAFVSFSFLLPSNLLRCPSQRPRSLTVPTLLMSQCSEPSPSPGSELPESGNRGCFIPYGALAQAWPPGGSMLVTWRTRRDRERRLRCRRLSSRAGPHRYTGTSVARAGPARCRSEISGSTQYLRAGWEKGPRSGSLGSTAKSQQRSHCPPETGEEQQTLRAMALAQGGLRALNRALAGVPRESRRPVRVTVHETVRGRKWFGRTEVKSVALVARDLD